MHILMTTDAVGGVWSYSLTLAAALAHDHGTRVTLAVVGPPPSAAQIAEVLARPGLDLHIWAGQLEWQPGCAADLAESAAWLAGLAGTIGADLIHSNQFAYGALGGACPMLVVAHSDLLSWHAACQPLNGAVDPHWRAFLHEYQAVVQRGLTGAAAVVCPTAAVAADLRRHYQAPADLRVIYNGTEPPGPLAPRAPGPRRVLSVGRLWDPAKNVAWLLEAVGDGIPGLDVAVAGSMAGPDGATLAPPAGAVRWLGALPHAALLNEMAQSHVYVGPSRYEPFGLAPLEAATRGCTLLLNDIASFREIWGPGATYCRSVAELRAALVAIAGGAPLDPQPVQEWATRYTVAAQAAAYQQLYAQLCQAVAPRLVPVPAVEGTVRAEGMGTDPEAA
ncbi:MAG TPA: glycosyltransferase [Chloroflexia bacterium]|nr:glycosyltransferase [Chloroflexia bacterium]